MRHPSSPLRLFIHSHLKSHFWSLALLSVSLLFCSAELFGFQETTTSKPPINKLSLLQQETFWDNRDWDWYLENIPFVECPDRDIQTTYYYRWEVVTKHLTYGSPRSGYSFTEFIDRPFWSGRYGAISCPAGHQLYEVRWLRDSRYATDYCRYWFRTPGAQPRNYSTWLADAAWATSLIHPDASLYHDILPDMIANWEGWQKSHFDESTGLFWQTGHDDGMEFNINSRQTKDILRGAPAYRPTINSYMWADAMAISRFAKSAGDKATAERFSTIAASIKDQLQKQLWDANRTYFFPKSKQNESLDGFDVKAGTLTYQSGKFAGNPHGRELIGLVPWQFNLPDAGFESAWKFLMDPNYFLAAYGPTVTERKDPLFLVTNHCCWWSGQSWPYATSQTLTALANLLHHYQQDVVSRDDYVELLKVYTRTHRKDGRPYIAEAANPDSGSWEGYDNYNHSEHYFHSSYCDLILSGLAGIKPRGFTQEPDGSTNLQLTIDPLFSKDWEYFAVVDAPMSGHRLTLLWDRSGTRYNRGKGLVVLLDDKLLAQRNDLGLLEVKIPVTSPPQQTKTTQDYRPARANWIVNNDGTFFPRITASSTNEGTMLAKIYDGNIFYHKSPPNRWLSQAADKKPAWIEVDFGTIRSIDEFRLYFLEDDDVAPPKEFAIEYADNQGNWQKIVPQSIAPKSPTGRTSNRIRLKTITTTKLRLLLTPSADKPVGLTEWEAWGDVGQDTLLDNQSIPFPGNIALNAGVEGSPKATASFTSPYDKVEMANDGLVSFQPQPHNRWTSYASKSNSDWLELRWASPQSMGRVELAIYDDRGGVQPPKSIKLQAWIDGQWQTIDATAEPVTPAGGSWNVFRFETIKTEAIRMIFEHRDAARSGVSEVLVFEK